MFRLFICGFAAVAFSFCLFPQNNSVGGQTSVITPLDGVYEFVSESTVITSPRKTTYERDSTDWSGLWQLQDGHYTRVLMKRRRVRFFDAKKLDDLGFESFAGSYKVKGDTILLSHDYAFNPFEVGGSSLFTYKIDGDKLTLLEKLYPRVESMREGTITTVLRRVK